MFRPLRRDSEGVASTVATMFTLLVVLLLLQLTLVSVLPSQEYDAEWATSREAIEAFEHLRLATHLAVSPGDQFSIPVPLGTGAVSPFSFPRPGRLRFDPANTTAISASFRSVPHLIQAEITKLDQDVILLMDSSGSMNWNDPLGLRICSAQEYVRNLIPPDRVAIVDFDSVARFTRANVGQPVHHLNHSKHNELLYIDPQADLGTIATCNAPFSNSGATNFGEAIRIANDEFAAYGNPAHEWIMILLTDGRNCCTDVPAMNARALSESLEAARNGTTIYTIGLGSDLDEPILRQIAANTGGIYYRASTAAEIRWVYFEISRRYLSAFQCGLLTTEEASFGALELRLEAVRYPAQTLRMEGGAIDVRQTGGSALWRGMPLAYQETGDGLSLSLTFATFVGDQSTATGTGYEIVQGRVIGRDKVSQSIEKAPLGGTSAEIKTGRTEFEYWANQGAATPAAVASVSPSLIEAERRALWAQQNWTARDFVDAKFNADRAQAQLAIAIGAIDNGIANGQIQRWLGFQTRDDALLNACRLDQWLNWYDGVTVRVTSSNAVAWSLWFSETFRSVGAGVTTSTVGGVAVIAIRAVDMLVVDRRLIEITLGA